MKKNVLNQEGYDTPEVIVVEMSVEKGFANSTTWDNNETEQGGSGGSN